MAGIVEGAAAMQQQQAAVHSREASFSESPEVLLAHDDDSELEVNAHTDCCCAVAVVLLVMQGFLLLSGFSVALCGWHTTVIQLEVHDGAGCSLL